MVSALSKGNVEQFSCGNIQRESLLSNGRVLYKVTDSQGKPAGQLTVPQEEADVFETSYKKIMISAKKIKKYVEENSSESDLRRRRSLGRNIVATCGLVGGAVPVMLLWKIPSMTKKILGTVAGVVTGLACGFAASLSVTTPPGTMEFAKAHRTLSTLDIQKFDETV